MPGAVPVQPVRGGLPHRLPRIEAPGCGPARAQGLHGGPAGGGIQVGSFPNLLA